MESEDARIISIEGRINVAVRILMHGIYVGETSRFIILNIVVLQRSILATVHL